ncbi:hypothetical protein Golax_000642, partial [Gossypium laxum]|nr:hypothetical protein [Gossypium laxum]
MKVSLVVYAMVEMNESDRVMWQFRFRKMIPYDSLSNREPIIAYVLACDSEYMPWFRHHGKPYLLVKEARGRLHHIRRPRRAPRHPWSGVATE